ncbi:MULTISPECIES: hypothetical protein [Streptomyces]|nr:MULTISPECIES: hypothetical protein [Streptomyces]
MATAIPPKPTYPRPPIQHEDLFREPVYTDGQPYTADEEDEEASAAITA